MDELTRKTHKLIKSFPSLISPIPTDDYYDSRTPLQFEYEDRKYALGRLVREQKRKSVKTENLLVRDELWKKLLIGSFLQAKLSEASLVCGFPWSRIKQNAQELKKLEGSEFAINTLAGSRVLRLRETVAYPESYAHAIGIFKTLGIQDRSLYISIGYGTVESVESLGNGKPLKESLWGDQNLGLRRCALILKELLTNESVVEPDYGGDEVWYDYLMRYAYNTEKEQPRVMLGDRCIDSATLKTFVDKALGHYMEECLRGPLQRLLRNVDYRLNVVLTGGGAVYDPIVTAVRKMAGESGLSFAVCDKKLALRSAVIGYRSIAEKKAKVLAGPILACDFGNAHTAFSVVGGE